MQKKIIALAVAAAFSAPAFADTTVYGVADVAVANFSATGVKGGTAVASGGLASSRLGVKASEDLGNGMKAIAVMEYGVDATTANTANVGVVDKNNALTGTSPATASTIVARQQLLAIAGDFGTVAAGYLQTTGYDFSRFDPTAGSLVSPLGNITKKYFMIGNQAALKRAPKALAYISPDFSGVSFALNYSADTASGLGDANTPEGDLTTKGTAYLASASYAAGPLAAGFVYASATSAIDALGVGGVKTTEWAIGGSYDLEMAKLFATYQSNKVDGANDSDKVYSFGATVPVTAAGTAVVSYAKATMTALNAAGVDMNASGFTVAWLQGLSKTTTAYAAISTMGQGADSTAISVAQNSLSNVAAGEGSRMIAVGLNKKF